MIELWMHSRGRRGRGMDAESEQNEMKISNCERDTRRVVRANNAIDGRCSLHYSISLGCMMRWMADVV